MTATAIYLFSFFFLSSTRLPFSSCFSLSLSLFLSSCIPASPLLPRLSSLAVVSRVAASCEGLRARDAALLAQMLTIYCDCDYQVSEQQQLTVTTPISSS